MLRIILFPLAILYDLVTRIRNYQYDRGYKPSARFEIPVINIGNLSVGGTGKTPMVEHLIRLLYPSYKTATLSRGYGRKTKGFRVANTSDDAFTIGDEPLQFFKKYGNKVMVSVGEERALAIPNILQQDPDVDVVLMDDAFQHRKVKPSLNILLTDSNRPFYNDYILPAGRLREARVGVNRADIVVVTKCPPAISDDSMMEMEKSIRTYTEKPVFFTTISYGNLVPFESTHQAVDENILLVTGIANADPLKDYLQNQYTIVQHLAYPDHHAYTKNDLIGLRAALAKQPKATIIVTTEKDMVKLATVQFSEFTLSLPLFYLPIEVSFIKYGKDFDEIVLNHIKRVL